MRQAKIFANGSTTIPKPVREAPGVEVSESVRDVISKDGVQIVKAQSVPETAGMLTRTGQS